MGGGIESMTFGEWAVIFAYAAPLPPIRCAQRFPVHVFETMIVPFPRHRSATAILLALLGAIFAGTAANVLAAVEVNVTRVGLPCVAPPGDIIRYGQWTPVVVDVDLVAGEEAFDGYLRIAQYDANGDQAFDRVDVSLRADTGGRRYFLFVVANPGRDQNKYRVEVFNENEELVEVVNQGELSLVARPAEPPRVIDHDDLIVLSLTDGGIGRIVDLADDSVDQVLERDVLLTHIAPRDLPPLWIGLEMVDYIVWDDAHPELLTEKQREALMDWVRRGGTLVLAASRSAPTIAQVDEVNEALPVDIGIVKVVDDLPLLRQEYLRVVPIEDEDDAAPLDPAEHGNPLESPRRKGGFPSPVPVVECTLRDGAYSLLEDGEGIEKAILTKSRYGDGFVVFSGVTLADLFSGEVGSPRSYFRRLFNIGVIGAEQTVQHAQVLFSKVAGAIAFIERAGGYIFVAGMFSFLYMIAATVGAWWFLGRRGWRHHAWTAFALVALAATAMSFASVKTIRGFGAQVRQLSVVDIDAGETFAQATVLFGLKTGSDVDVDLWLPSQPGAEKDPTPMGCMLRPIPETNLLVDRKEFVDPTEYRLIPASAEIHETRLRATLKRFEGRWHGPINGRVTADIRVRQPAVTEEGRRRPHFNDWRITEDSYIVNELGVDLVDCFLLHTVRERQESRRPTIFAYPIGEFPAGEKLLPAEVCYAVQDDSESVFEWMENNELEDHQNQWASAFRSLISNIGYQQAPATQFTLGEERKALLLASTVGELDPDAGARNTFSVMGRTTFSRDRLRQLDLRDHFQRDAVYLLGFAEDAGPPRLYLRDGGDYKSVPPDPTYSRTMYRVRIPARYEGEATDVEDENEDAFQ